MTIERVVGASLEETAATNIPRSLMVQYAGASGDFNPLHTDEVYAREVAGYPSVLAHGMLTMGLTASVVRSAVKPNELTSFGGRFLQPVFPGDDLIVRLEVTSVMNGNDESMGLSVLTLNQSGTPVFSGTASARVHATHP